MAKFLDKTGLDTFWAKIKSTFQTLGNLVTSWGSTPSDTKYPSEKLVKDSLDAKAPNTPSEVTIANGDKIIIADSSDSSKVKRASVAFDGSTTKNFLSKKGTFEEVKESDVAWGGDFHADLSPIEMGMFPQNLIANPPPENIKYEQTTDGGETWSVVSLTDYQKKQFCNLTSGVVLPAGPTTTDDNVLPLQRGRVTIALLPFGATEYSDTWCYGQVKRILLYVNRTSSPEVAHCVVEVQTGPHFIANDGVWTTLGDYNVTGDGGWNSIPIGDLLGGYSLQLSGRRVAIRFTYWITKKPTSGSGGRISLYSLGILPGTVWKSNANAVAKQKLPVQVENDGTGTVQKSRSLATARKLKTNLARTADSTFDGSADQTNIPVTGTLPVGNGGTGKASVTAGSFLVGNGTNALAEKTPNAAANDLINALTTGESTPTDNDYYVAQYAGGGTTTKTFHRRPVKALWEYIKGKISSVLGLTVTSYGGNAATATKATQDSDGNAINATYFKSSGNTTLVAGAATKIGTQNGADVKLTLPAHQDISGKMATDGSDATSTAGGNIIRAMGDWNNPADAELFAAASTNNTQGKYTFLKFWSNYLKGKLSSDSGVNISGTATFATRALGFTINTFNNSTKRAQLGIATIDSGSLESSMTCLVRLDSVAGPGGNGRNMSILVSLMCRGTERHLKAIVLEDNAWNAYSASNKPVIVTFPSDNNTKLHVCLGIKNSSGTLIDFTYTKTRVLPLTEYVNWTWTTATDSSTSYTDMFDCEYPRASYADSAGSAGNADTVDGKHVVFGAYAGAADTIYFG